MYYLGNDEGSRGRTAQIWEETVKAQSYHHRLVQPMLIILEMCAHSCIPILAINWIDTITLAGADNEVASLSQLISHVPSRTNSGAGNGDFRANASEARLVLSVSYTEYILSKSLLQIVQLIQQGRNDHVNDTLSKCHVLEVCVWIRKALHAVCDGAPEGE